MIQIRKSLWPYVDWIVSHVMLSQHEADEATRTLIDGAKRRR
jgi:hypothetical protein